MNVVGGQEVMTYSRNMRSRIVLLEDKPERKEQREDAKECHGILLRLGTL